MSIVNNQIGFTTVPAHAYLGPLLHRRRQVDPGADLPRERRRPRSGGVLRPHRGRVPHAVRRPTSCSTSSATAATATTRPTSRPSPSRSCTAPIRNMKTTRTLYAERLARRGRACRPSRRRRCADEVQRDARSRLRGGADLQAEQGRLAGRPLGRPAPAASSGIEQPRGADRRLRRDACARSARRSRTVPESFNVNPKIAAPARGQAGDDRERRGHRLGDRRGAGLRHAAAGGHRVRLSGRGHAARHLQPAPRRAGRPDEPERIRAAEQHRARPGAVRDLQLAALRSRACSASNTATGSPIRTRWCCGRRSSAISPTARRSSSTSSSPAARPSGCACRAS